MIALATVTVMLTFEDSLGTLPSLYADSMGRHVAEFEVFDGNQMNPPAGGGLCRGAGDVLISGGGCFRQWEAGGRAD